MSERVACERAWEGARDAYRGRILRLTEERDAAIREREELRDSLNRCPECNGEGQHDSGGMDASGEWINLPCDGCRSTGKMQGYVQATDKLRARVAELEAAQAASGGGEQPRGWLTERDTKTLIDAAVFLSGKGERGMSEAIEWLLARSTPPEVVKPNEKHYHHITCSSRDADWLAALAAAGVEVKEVG